MKVYEKPRVSIERFTLSQHVADCGWELQAADENSCYAIADPAWGYIDGKAFLRDSVVCEADVEAYCYTPSSGDTNLFRS